MEWLFSTMCGISVAGENRFTVKPCPGGSFSFAEARYNSVYGMIGSKWEKKDGRTVYTVLVPANCEAEVILPGGTCETIGAGQHTFTEE